VVNEFVCHFAFGALVELCDGNAVHQDAIIAAGALGLIVAAFRTHETSEIVCQYFMWFPFEPSYWKCKVSIIAAVALSPIVTALRIN